MRRFFTEDFARGASLGTNNIHLLATAKDKKSGNLLGAIYFVITPDFAYGDVRNPVFGIVPEAQQRGLGKILMSSIFKALPAVQRVSLSTRITNAGAIKAYSAWGFKAVPQTWENWANLEYRTEESNLLQKVAEQLESCTQEPQITR